MIGDQVEHDSVGKDKGTVGRPRTASQLKRSDGQRMVTEALRLKSASLKKLLKEKLLK